MIEASPSKTYLVETTPVNRSTRKCTGHENAGKSNDVYENKQLKNDILTSPTMLMKTHHLTPRYPTMLLNNKELNLFFRESKPFLGQAM